VTRAGPRTRRRAARLGGAPPDPADRAAWPVVLVSMPFAEIDRPSIQLGLLAAVLRRDGWPVRTLHANLDLAVRLGAGYYGDLAEHRGRQVGDWLFSLEAFGDTAPDPDSRLVDDLAAELVHLGGAAAGRRERLLRTRLVDVPAYLDALLDALPWHEARVVGFSSTFQQNAASFALARRLKARYPGLVTVFGGANFDGEMGPELVRTVDCVDLAVVGEGETALPRLLTALAAGTDPAAVPGVVRRDGDRVAATPAAPPLTRLDDLPAPDYTEYFDRAERLGLLTPAGRRDVWLPVETARGCWWGAKHHCTFCGLNGTTMAFRAKSAPRVLGELAEQARRYRSFRFAAVDNILDPTYLRTLFPALVEARSDYELFYEVKANLTRGQLRLLARAGVAGIQPGLESLSSRVLGLMRKGVRAAQNVNVLRWARYYGVDVAWNVLWGFPGETAADYAEQAAAMPYLTHLAPPVSADRIWLERFSPLHAGTAGGVRHRTPERSYRAVYPADVDLERVAYFFEYDVDGALPDAAYDGVRAAVRAWRRAWQAPDAPALTYWSAPGFLQIHDSRPAGRAGTYTFQDTLADVYLACGDRPTTAAAVRTRLGLADPVDAVQEVFAEFARHGLMFLDGPYALALALPAVRGR
jgi:ribosomal peptide maturation radical SAM protein 1